MQCGWPGPGTVTIRFPAAMTVPGAIPATSVLVQGKPAPSLVSRRSTGDRRTAAAQGHPVRRDRPRALDDHVHEGRQDREPEGSRRLCAARREGQAGLHRALRRDPLSGARPSSEAAGRERGSRNLTGSRKALRGRRRSVATVIADRPETTSSTRIHRSRWFDPTPACAPAACRCAGGARVGRRVATRRRRCPSSGPGTPPTAPSRAPRTWSAACRARTARS